ncbi:MAG TPA: cyclic nucleotide-binding domain-containing protein [Kofleriaceae bacterium]
MAKDGRALREEAAAAVAAGKHKRALSAYLELERIEARDAQWAKRAAETYRRLGNNAKAIEAFERSAERYAQNGFLVQSIAVCKIILQIDPRHADTLRRVAEMNELIGAGQTRAATIAENNPALHENPNVAAIRMGRSGNTPPQPGYDERYQRPRRNTPAVVAMPRTKSRPISLSYGAALDSVELKTQIPTSHTIEGGDPGIHVIPIDEDEFEQTTTNVDAAGIPRELQLEADEPEPGIELEASELESTELDLADLEEIPLAEPRAIGSAAARALAATPLFAGMTSDALQALVANLQLVSLTRGEILFREGEASDALYVIAEGEVAVQHMGPPPTEALCGEGSFLGEVALMTDQPWTATVICVRDAELLRIDRQTLSSVLANHGDMLRAVLRFVRDRLVDRWTRTSPLFRPFNDAQRLELAAKFRFLEIDAGTIILGAGDRPDGLYIVLAGLFVVVRNGTPIAELGPGDLIGETALLAGGAFKSDVVARGKGLALCLPAAVFREVIMTHPHVLEYIGEHAEHSRRLQIL